MLKKHAVLLGILLSLSLLVIATLHYPGGSQIDKNSIGYSWRNNYISNLFAEKAVNGSANTSRFWAISGMIFLSASFALFFAEFSKRIPTKSAANLVKYVGELGMIFAFLIATSLHDIMVTISSTLFLISLFYITVFVFKSKLNWLKLSCTLGLITFYVTLYMYGSGSLKYLPVMQKVNFATTIVLILSLHYFTRKEDFELVANKQKSKTP